jgi:hypothetical protein
MDTERCKASITFHSQIRNIIQAGLVPAIDSSKEKNQIHKQIGLSTMYHQNELSQPEEMASLDK